MDHIASDMADLTGVSLAALRGLPASMRTRRLLDEARWGGSAAMSTGGGTNPPGNSVDRP
ncbi:hypothetical protein RNC47_25555 [Streptomyces sp. DSM 44918]|uniref:FXSXX-COOH protein n=1 Tax=Streptomyces millisiae TaxID=3075542 RepID=A0ABU2LWX5_9ACTN|nr:hypothetical protein [Streptomyces sp. DSM 44918]